MSCRHFVVHGIRLAVRSDLMSTLDSATELLGRFALPEGEVVHVPDLVLRFRHARTSLVRELADEAVLDRATALPGRSSRWWIPWPYSIYREPGARVVFFHDHAMLRLRTSSNEAEAFLRVAGGGSAPANARLFVAYAVAEILRGAGLFSLHAAAVEKEGRAVLMPGRSGQGKTTSLLALVRARYRCLADDHPFVRMRSGRVEVLACDSDAGVGAGATRWFPEIAAARTLSNGSEKVRVPVEVVYPDALAEGARVKAIVFPRIVESERSRIEIMSRGDALEAILAATFSLSESRTLRRQFECLTQLVREAVSYRLHFGRDVECLPTLIDPLLQ